ncbi:hypothetical protein ASPWEDRAFT_114325 [Aspergillus wentii DTO 134E9]|uniref:Uncharacterized protein n=1 Tax=Aspergillus wentii DTO 134E9 TaxID=1073089 RepID=A0A1L9RI51_ASPWE|nr:uncharacterized protein ASPWEDRAFT_114325 [Aspergillus wentii DTO 134E9]OJJ34601.1 hypothetical protein ASPWEDRAFT_114325 [Aspergillus wentii DTO 134E9]
MSLISKLASKFPWASAPLVVGAPMRVFSGPALATAISSAGGLGFIGPGTTTQNTVKDLEETFKIIQDARSTSSFKGLPSTYDSLPVGVGFQLWSDDLDIASAAIQNFKPCAAWLYAPRNGQSDLDIWSEKIRTASPDIQIWVQIGTIAEVKGLLQSSHRPDAIIVQGTEAGGHGRRDGIGLMSLLPEIADIVKESGIPLLAAGGIADGRGAAAALCLGASGIVMGTRFLASNEARISKGYQQEVVRAKDGAANTVRTLLYNHLRGTTGWPEPYVPRGIINKTWADHLEGKSFEELKKLHDESAATGDKGWGPEGRVATYAGASIGLIHDIKSASDIVRDMQDAFQEQLDIKPRL